MSQHHKPPELPTGYAPGQQWPIPPQQTPHRQPAHPAPPQQWMGYPPQQKRRWNYADWYRRQPLHVRIPILLVCGLFSLVVATLIIIVLIALVMVIAGVHAR